MKKCIFLVVALLFCAVAVQAQTPTLSLHSGKSGMDPNRQYRCRKLPEVQPALRTLIHVANGS
jgi:hypothetical protein